MKLNVHVLGRHVGILEQVGDFKSVMTYVPDVVPENLVSLTMPVRTESYPWDDQLHPIFQMNLPEGYLLQVVQEEFGPHIGASPVALLSIIGRNMVGRLQVAPSGAALDEPAKPIEVAELLKGDNSRLLFCNSRIFSSTVSRAISRYAKTGRCCPMRYVRSTACASTAGFHQGSRMNTYSAAVSCWITTPRAGAESRPVSIFHLASTS